MRIAGELADDQPPAGAHHAADLGERGGRVRLVAERGDEVGGVEGRGLEGQVAGVAECRGDVRKPAPAGGAHRLGELIGMGVEDVDRPVGEHGGGDLKRVGAVPGADLEHPLAGARREQRVEGFDHRERGGGSGAADGGWLGHGPSP